MSWADKTSGDKTEYDNTNKGTLFNNSYKTKPNQPDVRGDLNIDGKEFKLFGWIRTAKKSGDQFFSIGVEPKDEEQEVKQVNNAIGEVVKSAESTDLPPTEDGEDVPF